jgi:hypothetical protein
MKPLYRYMMKRIGPSAVELIQTVSEREESAPIYQVCAGCPGACKVHQVTGVKFYCHRKNYLKTA